jgi:hypothetical protein
VHLPATTEIARYRYGLTFHIAPVVDGQIGNAESLPDIFAGRRVLAVRRVDKLY